MEEKMKAFKDLLEIMDELREKCPWDKKQSLDSLRTLTIEECYELSDAIYKKDMHGIKEELGDLLLHIVFYAKIGDEKNAFDILDVIRHINEKLKFRHPHIFGDIKVADAKEVEENWEKLKLQEGKKTVLGGIPDAMPALIKAYRMQDKARGVGFDWDEKEQIWEKVQEEISELMEELKHPNNNQRIESEFGDVFFSLINAARLYGINPENALESTNRKFRNRFNFLEDQTISRGKSLHEMDLDEMNRYWDLAKTLAKDDEKKER